MQNLPTIITCIRIAVIPFLVATFYLPEPLSTWVVSCLFAAACLSDYVDGWVARKFNAVSSFGRFLDQIADKLLVTAAILMLVKFGRADIVPAVAILCREIFVSGLREYLSEKNIIVHVSGLAKIKTATQMVALLCLLLAPNLSWFGTPGDILLWVAALLTVYTGLDYLKAALLKK